MFTKWSGSEALRWSGMSVCPRWLSLLPSGTVLVQLATMQMSPSFVVMIIFSPPHRSRMAVATPVRRHAAQEGEINICTVKPKRTRSSRPTTWCVNCHARSGDSDSDNSDPGHSMVIITRGCFNLDSPFILHLLA